MSDSALHVITEALFRYCEPQRSFPREGEPITANLWGKERAQSRAELVIRDLTDAGFEIIRR